MHVHLGVGLHVRTSWVNDIKCHYLIGQWEYPGGKGTVEYLRGVHLCIVHRDFSTPGTVYSRGV